MTSLATVSYLPSVQYSLIKQGSPSDFHFPYHLEGPLVDRGSMERIGDHYPPVNLTDPMRWIVMDEYRRCCQKVDVGPQSALAQLPFQPGLRAQAA